MKRIFDRPVEEGKRPEWKNYFDTLLPQVKEPLRMAYKLLHEELEEKGIIPENGNIESALLTAHGAFKRWDLLDDFMMEDRRDV